MNKIFLSHYQIHFEQKKDILLVKLLHGTSMLAGMPVLVSALQSIQLISVFVRHDGRLASSFWLVQLFFVFSLVNLRVINLPGRTETGLITGSDKTVRAVHSCKTG